MTERKIDHATEAMVCIKAAHRTDDGTFTMIQAQVHATLALVEQQRIASLVALRQADSDVIGDFEWEDVDRDIREGLGLA